MAIFQITVVNQTFEAHNQHDLPTEEDARAEAIRGALEIGLDEIGVASPLFAAEVKIASDGEQIARYVVSMGVSPLR
jgi:hypothetical protein